MIKQALEFIVDQLNASFSQDGEEKLVDFPGKSPEDAVVFKNEAITTLLIKLEEEKILRPNDRYYRYPDPKADDKTVKKAPPPVILHLFVLFVARFNIYDRGLLQLSNLIQFFQAHPVLKSQNNQQSLPELRIELQSSTFTAQNEIWSMLKAPLHPHVMYKVTLLLLEDENAEEEVRVIEKDGVRPVLSPEGIELENIVNPI